MHRTGKRTPKKTDKTANAKFFHPETEEDLIVTRNRNNHMGHVGEEKKADAA